MKVREWFKTCAQHFFYDLIISYTVFRLPFWILRGREHLPSSPFSAVGTGIGIYSWCWIRVSAIIASALIRLHNPMHYLALATTECTNVTDLVPAGPAPMATNC